MNRDSRLSVSLHVLLHMSEQDAAMTSEALGSMMDTNPVVLRRTLAGLRDAGIVSAEKGHGGGWALARELTAITVGDVYEAIRPGTLFGIGPRDPDTRCPIEQAVNAAVDDALVEAEALVVRRLRALSLADVLRRAKRRKSS
jgi:DNA-binding IscR family transcriptional regulator